MEFSYKVEPDGWAIITHADGEHYRIRYDNMGEPLCVDELHLMIVDGQDPQVHRPTTQRVHLTRLGDISENLREVDICDTAGRFLHANGFECIGADYVMVIVRLLEVRDTGEWVVNFISTNRTLTIGAAKYQHNS